MARIFACALIGALLVASFAALTPVAPAAPVPQHLMKESVAVYYFPTKVGAKLVYEEPGCDGERELVVTAVAERGGAKIISIGQVTRDGEIVPQGKMRVTGDNLSRIEYPSYKPGEPEVWLKLPATRDLSWEYRTGFAGLNQTLVTSTVTGEEDVVVPAGTFRCIRVQTRQGDRNATYWFAPEVGVVKIEATHWTEELKSYTPGKD